MRSCRWWLVAEFEVEGGEVIAAGAFESGFDESWSGGKAFFCFFWLTQELENLAVPEAVNDAVGAEEEGVAGFEGDGADLGRDELVAGTQGLVEGVAEGVGAGFAFVYFSGTLQPTDMAVIVTELLQAGRGIARCGKKIEAAVAQMGEVEPTGNDPSKSEGGPHAGAFLVLGAEVVDGLIDVGVELFKQVGKAGREPGGHTPVGFGEKAGNFFHGDAAGEFTGLGSSHAIADGKEEVSVFEAAGIFLAEVMEILVLEGENEEGVLIVLADFSGVGHA